MKRTIGLYWFLTKRLIAFRGALKYSKQLCSRYANEASTLAADVELLAEQKRKLELKVKELSGELEIKQSHIESLTLVIKRNHERIAAETAMYMAAASGEPVRDVGAVVAQQLTPGL